MKLKKKYLMFIRILLLAIFVLCAFHFIATWLYFLVNPFIDSRLIGFTWLGFFVNLFELFYCIWFSEYFYENMGGE